jgi:hypothetical protein
MEGQVVLAGWQKSFDDRQRREIELARLYAKDFHHGTTGHNALMIIAKMADLLDLHEMQATMVEKAE